MSRPARFSPRWWVSDADGRVAVAQLPNPAIGVWLVTVVARLLLPEGERADMVLWMGRGALVVWALDELLRGDSPARRVLGAGVLVFQLAQLLG